MSAFDDLMTFQRETEALSQVSARLGWDQETKMPRGAAGQREEEVAALEAVLHARRCDPKIGDMLALIDPAQLDDVGQAQVRLIRRDYDKATQIPASLATAIARTTSRAQVTWIEARADGHFADFAPVLEEVLNLRREQASIRAKDGNLYDALLDDYEPGAKGADLEAMFSRLRPRLVELRAMVLDRPSPAALDRSFDEDKQMELSGVVAQSFGYDLQRGRIDKAVHPFSSGSGNDVRITTRTVADDPFNCLYSTIHEVGHASYEQNIDAAYLLTPLGAGVSMGVHESQSRIYENQLGRSRAYCGWLYGKMCDAFGDFGIPDADAFYATVNRLKNGYIRTEADEVQYNLHVLLRFDLERALISGDLAVMDLETAWNDRFQADFGFVIDKASNGVLQDVHWSAGLFGYFPTYTLGNVYAGCLHAALQKAQPDLDGQLARGETTQALTWLRDRLQRHGGLRTPLKTIEHAAAMTVSEEPLLDYLETKFAGIYGLKAA